MLKLVEVSLSSTDTHACTHRITSQDTNECEEKNSDFRVGDQADTTSTKIKLKLPTSQGSQCGKTMNWEYNIALVVFLTKKAQHKPNHMENTRQRQWRDSLEKKKMAYSFHRTLHEKTGLVMQQPTREGPNPPEKVDILNNNLITMEHHKFNVSGMSIISQKVKHILFQVVSKMAC